MELHETNKIHSEQLATCERLMTETQSALGDAIARLNETEIELRETSSSLKDVKTRTRELEQRKTTYAQVGFTVTYPKDNSDPRIFQKVVYNSGSGFNIATGKFVCQHAGIYLFTATLIRESSTNWIRCCISVNGSSTLWVHASDSSSRSGNPSASGTLVVHLDPGDEVYLQDCSEQHIDSWSSFGGVLIQRDAN